MKCKPFVAAAAALTLLSAPLFAGEATIMVNDPYARSSGPTAKAGAAFMEIMNMGDQDDRLIAVRSDIAKRVELHTHKDQGDGVMKMIHVEEGFDLPAGESLMLMRGGKHVMFMGLTQPMVQGETVNVTLTFENAGDVAIDIPVDLERKPQAGHGDSQGAHSH